MTDSDADPMGSGFDELPLSGSVTGGAVNYTGAVTFTGIIVEEVVVESESVALRLPHAASMKMIRKLKA